MLQKTQFVTEKETFHGEVDDVTQELLVNQSCPGREAKSHGEEQRRFHVCGRGMRNLAPSPIPNGRTRTAWQRLP